MAAKTFYLMNTAVGTIWQGLSESTQVAATLDPCGWVVGTGSTNHSHFRQGVERASGTFTDTVPPDGTLGDSGFGDSFRSENTLSGDFAAANWEAHFVVRAITNGGAQGGRVRFRLFKADSDGSNATEITSGHQQASAVTGVSTSADFDSTLTFNPGAFSITNQYLFFQIAWERTVAGGMTNSDIAFRTGSSSSAGTRILTADLSVGVTGDLAATDPADTAALTGAVLVAGDLTASEAGDMAALSGDVLVQGDLTAVEAADSFAADGSVSASGISGDLAATESADTAALEGDVIVSGSLAATESIDNAISNGQVHVTGTLSLVESVDTVAADGAVVVAGTLVATEVSDAASFDGAVLVSGDLAATEAHDTALFSGQGLTTGTLAAVEAPDGFSADGNVLISGTWLVVEPPDTAGVDGSVLVSGELIGADSPDIAALLGSLERIGILAATENPDVLIAISTGGEPEPQPASTAYQAVKRSLLTTPHIKTSRFHG